MPKQEENLASNVGKYILPFGVTLGVLMAVWGGYKLINPTPVQNSSPTPTDPPKTSSSPSLNLAGLNMPSAEIDSDHDGLSDAMEAIYKTDPNNPDTDGDGYKDGSEVNNGYDPTIPSPNDKISGSLKLSSQSPLPAANYTQQYANQTGTTPTVDSLLQNEDQMNQFINETNARGILPVILDSDLTIIKATGKSAINTYLDTLSVGTNKSLSAVDTKNITDAFTVLVQTGNSAQLDAVIAKIRNNLAVFQKTSVPEEAKELHKKYLGAVTALLNNAEALKNYKNDYVGTLVAASRLEGLRAIFTEIQADIKNLEKKYNIT